MIMSPTRELSKQIFDVITSLSQYIKGLRKSLLIGGISADETITDLKSNVPHIIVGCPGRIHDMIRRKHISPQTLKLIVLDEADEMLSIGFKSKFIIFFNI